MSLRNANEDLKQVITAIYHRHCGDYLTTYADIESDTELELKEIKKLVKTLKTLGYVKVGNGVDDDGLLAGRGFYIVREKEAEVDLLDAWMEEQL
jgi:radical SAM superfamily enzyme YgiQ (UPF0313 family)